jgi:hypothetical protein
LCHETDAAVVLQKSLSEPEALAHLVGWKVTLRELALRMRCSRCGKKAAEVVAVARPRLRGVPTNPHERHM